MYLQRYLCNITTKNRGFDVLLEVHLAKNRPEKYIVGTADISKVLRFCRMNIRKNLLMLLLELKVFKFNFVFTLEANYPSAACGIFDKK
jgi:hypothetical protein